mgnify:CR=1 FL=1
MTKYKFAQEKMDCSFIEICSAALSGARMFKKLIFSILCTLIIGESVYLVFLYQKWKRLQAPPVSSKSNSSLRIISSKIESKSKIAKKLSSQQKEILKYYRLLRQNPQDSEVLFKLGNLYRQLGLFLRAYKYLQLTLRVSPQHKHKKYIQDQLEKLKRKIAITENQGIIKK